MTGAGGEGVVVIVAFGVAVALVFGFFVVDFPLLLPFFFMAGFMVVVGASVVVDVVVVVVVVIERVV